MPVDRQDIEIDGDDGAFSAYLACPAQPNGVAIVVLQEIFGVNANIRAIADGFANDGYLAVAPDLYWRQQPGIQLDPNTEEGRARGVALMKGLDRDQAAADAVAALAEAGGRVPGIVRTAAVGYCFGGGVAYLLAVRNRVDLGIAYYGTYLHTLLDEAAGLKGRVLLHVAEQDHLCPSEARDAIRAALAPFGERAGMVVHAGVGHAFARAGGAAFDAAAAGRADAMTAGALAALVAA